MEIPSRLIEDAVTEISKLPGIGKKTALRLVMHLLKEDEAESMSLAEAIVKMRTEIQYCKSCFNISDTEICSICSSPNRQASTICVVENVTDLLAIENTGQYMGHYHVLGGVISPLEGIGPEMIKVEELLERAKKEEVQEIILALNSNMESDTTSFYLSKKLTELGLKVTTIARGVPLGSDLEYADEITLGRSIVTRTNYS